MILSNRNKATLYFIWMEVSFICVYIVWLIFNRDLVIEIQTSGDTTNLVLSTNICNTFWDSFQFVFVLMTFIYFMVEVYSNWCKAMKNYPKPKKRIFRSDILDDEFNL